MDQSTIVVRLREYESELKAAGIEHLALHGSRFREADVRETSDVDVIADFEAGKKHTLIGRGYLENRLSDILGLRADLCDRKLLRPEVLERATRKSVLVF